MSEVIREPGIRVVTKKTLPSNSKHITNGTLPMLDVLKGGRREDKVHATISERHSGGISANDVSIRVTKPRYFHPIGVDVRKDRHFRLEVFAKTRQRPSLTAADFKNPRRSAVQIGLCRTNELPFPPGVAEPIDQILLLTLPQFGWQTRRIQLGSNHLVQMLLKPY